MQKIVNLKNKSKNFVEFLKNNNINKNELIEQIGDKEEFESVEDIINFYSGKDNKTLLIKSID